MQENHVAGNLAEKWKIVELMGLEKQTMSRNWIKNVQRESVHMLHQQYVT